MRELNLRNVGREYLEKLLSGRIPIKPDVNENIEVAGQEEAAVSSDKV
jgi:hypothetical protein